MNKGDNNLARACRQFMKRTPEYRELRDIECPDDDIPKLAVVLRHKQDGGRKIQAYAMSVEVLYTFSPFDMSTRPELRSLWMFELCRLVLMDLEEGYEIAYMTPLAHFEMWYELNDMQEEIEYPLGLQRYLEYCRKKSVTKAELEKSFNYEGMDIMEWRQT